MSAIQLSDPEIEQSVGNLGPAAAMAIANQAILALNADNAEQHLPNIRNRVAWIKQEVKALDALLTDRTIEILQECGRDIVLNEFTRLYLGNPKDTDMIDGHDQDLVNDILRACGGDMDRLVKCLCSGWAKPGTVKKLFEEFGEPDLFDKHFKVTEKTVLKDGVVKKVKAAMVADSRFAK